MRIEQELQRRARIAGIVLGMALLVGCSKSKTRYVHPNVDLAAIQRVAVLPFENLSTDTAAGEKVHSLFLVELLSTGVFDVVEPGLVTKVLRAEGIQSTAALGPADFKRLGESIGADAFFLGSVVDFVEGGSGSAPAPEVTIQLRLVEARSGVTVWSASDSKSGSSLSSRLFGIGGKSLTEVARELLRRALRTLVQ
jgi:hypothetical protein